MYFLRPFFSVLFQSDPFKDGDPFSGAFESTYPGMSNKYVSYLVRTFSFRSKFISLLSSLGKNDPFDPFGTAVFDKTSANVVYWKIISFIYQIYSLQFP